MTEQVVYAQQIRVPYRYTAGREQQAFLRGLQGRRILGSRTADGRTLVPARPFDLDGTRTGELVEVEPVGTLQGWTVVGTGGEQRVFGLVRLDGADTDLLHLLDLDADQLERGRRVRARWAAEPEAEITAIEAFEAA